MERRKFMIGVGALASGAAAATGTGAFSAMSAERNANINVVGDDRGITALRSDTDSDVIRQAGNGELVIDFTADGSAGGVNVNSVYQIGSLTQPHNNGPEQKPFSRTPGDDAAFFVTNQDTVEHDVTLEYTVQNIGNAKIVFQLQDEDDNFNVGGNTNGDQTDAIVVGGRNRFGDLNNNDTTATATLSPGEKVGVSILIDTAPDGGADPLEDPTTQDLSGTLSVNVL
ncbi:hypothetical protein [Halorubrum distributum]|uniref:hypothetical protein n=1 Tax=Halorubrum distributum TaxID=29283 RepID=UPI001268495F|nr:hypothetical protein [Halorubrum arcis]